MMSNQVHSTTSAASSVDKPSYITNITGNDVLLGRGAPIIFHEGNIRFRSVVKTRREEYLAAGRNCIKNKISFEVMKKIHRNNGRFLRKIKTLQESRALGAPFGGKVDCWVIADEETVLTKIKQALREKEEYEKVSGASPQLQSETKNFYTSSETSSAIAVHDDQTVSSTSLHLAFSSLIQQAFRGAAEDIQAQEQQREEQEQKELQTRLLTELILSSQITQHQQEQPAAPAPCAEFLPEATATNTPEAQFLLNLARSNLLNKSTFHPTNTQVNAQDHSMEASNNGSHFESFLPTEEEPQEQVNISTLMSVLQQLLPIRPIQLNNNTQRLVPMNHDGIGSLIGQILQQATASRSPQHTAKVSVDNDNAALASLAGLLQGSANAGSVKRKNPDNDADQDSKCATRKIHKGDQYFF